MALGGFGFSFRREHAPVLALVRVVLLAPVGAPGDARAYLLAVAMDSIPEQLCGIVPDQDL